MNANIDPSFSPTDQSVRLLKYGMSVTRRSAGEGLVDFCAGLVKLQEQFPELEVRTLKHDGQRVPAIQQLGKAEVRRQQQSVGHLAFESVKAELLESIHSLSADEEVQFTEVTTGKDKGKGKFVTLLPRNDDEMWLRYERTKILELIDELADSHANWDWHRPCDMTIAYIPRQYGEEVKSTVLEVVNGLLPVHTNLTVARIA